MILVNLTKNNTKNSKLENLNHLFRAYDIRGIYGIELDSLMMFNIGISVGLKFQKNNTKESRAYVGYDIRKTSQLLAYAFVAGLTSTGTSVTFSNKPFPFGVVMYSGLQSEVKFTAYITASHLPANWNGIKFYFGDGVGVPESTIMDIRDIYNSQISDSIGVDVDWKKIQPITEKDYFKHYASFLKKNFSLDNPMKVIIDCGNGSSCLSAPEIFKTCNYEVIEQWCNVDPTFPNRPSEPNEETLKTLSKNIISKKDVKFGVGFDGDGDRAVIVDEKGNVISADIIAILLAKFLTPIKISSEKPIVLANIECSSAMEKSLHGTHIIKRIKVGHTFLTLEARNNREICVLGVESSGHFVFPQYFLFDDAILLPLLIGLLLQKEVKKLSELVSEIPKMFSKRKTYKCSDVTKFNVINELANDLDKEFSNINRIDGLAIQLDKKGYILIRASNTGPKIRIFIESDSESNVSELYEKFSPLIDQKINDL